MTTAVRRGIAAMALALLAAVNAATSRDNVRRTYDGKRSATMLQRLAGLRDVSPQRPVLLDVPDAFGALLAASYSRGHVTALLSGAVPSPADGLCDPTGQATKVYRISPALEHLACQWRASYRPGRFDLTSEPGSAHRFLRYVLPDDAPIATAVLVAPAADRQAVNNSWQRPADGGYHVEPLSDVHDHLVEIDSSIGHTIQPGVIEDVALWPYEPDFAEGGSGIQGIGRHLLFEILNPLPDSRLLLDFTAGGLSGMTGGLPPAQAIGENRSGFDFVGRGAARMLSGAIAPRMIDGHAYLAIDMGMAPLQFAAERKGILGLYNRRLSLDPRSLVGFVRNISLLSGRKLADTVPPAGVDSFPRGLFAPGLLFSGIYEDGWMAEVARLRLGVRAENRELRIKGMLPGPGSPGGTVLDIRADGQPILTQRVEPGNFELRAILPSQGPRWIEIRADHARRLPAPDGRVASVLLQSIGFERPD